MDGQCVSSEQSVNITTFNELHKGIPGILIKYHSWPQYPDNKSLLPFMFQKLIELIIVDGKGGFTREACTKCKSLREVLWKFKGISVNINAFFTILPSATGYSIPNFQMSKFFDLEGSFLFQDHNAIHSCFLQESPLTL